MEIAQKWNMLPADVYELYFSDPINYTFMRAKVRADFEWECGNTDVKPPDEDINLFQVLDRL